MKIRVNTHVLLATAYALGRVAASTTPLPPYTGPKPLHYGVVLYPGFQALDAYGPLDILNMVNAKIIGTKLSLIAERLLPVNTMAPGVIPDATWPGESTVPTYTFANAPEDIDVLIVPGGLGSRAEENQKPVIDFISKWLGDKGLGENDPSSKQRWLFSVCTGAGILAKGGFLDDKKATGNKWAWSWVVAQSQHVKWQPHARWVVDGNVWTSSGVAAGMDAMFAFVAWIYGQDIADNVANTIEYERHTDPNWDPFGEYWNVTAPEYIPSN